MIDLSTTYLGLKLRNPLVVSSSSLTNSVDKIRALEDHGAGAVVLKSIFEEQIVRESQRLDDDLSRGAESFAEVSNSYFADIPMQVGPEEYTQLVADAKKAVRIPVMASINCVGAANWASYAKKLERAGADAIELNVYYLPTDPAKTSAQIERT
ncbi:MAG: dihydroorotate dehydrogenase, partial [Polyangiaceae bacterium]|nr:dihydroorotate dehydrogenase [Polyangiaceae bacterium]